MSITNYTNLQSTIADFLNRDDLTSTIPVFVQLAESQLNRELRHWKMETRATATIDAGDQYSQVPGDWLETIRMSIQGAGTSVVNLISRASMADKRAGAEDTSGRPEYYCHADGQFNFYPTPDADYTAELLYFAEIPALASNSTNWLLTTAPDVYLYGSLMHSAPYLQEDPRITVWAQLYSAAVKNLTDSSERARYSGSGLTLKVRGLG